MQNQTEFQEGQLAEKKCVPCKGGVPPLPTEEKEKLMKELHPDWGFTHDQTRIERDVKFKNFAEAMKAANKLGDIAEEQGHHPELQVGFGHLTITVWTHKIGDLVESDFIYAAKVDKALSEVS